MMCTAGKTNSEIMIVTCPYCKSQLELAMEIAEGTPIRCAVCNQKFAYSKAIPKEGILRSNPVTSSQVGKPQIPSRLQLKHKPKLEPRENQPEKPRFGSRHGQNDGQMKPSHGAINALKWAGLGLFAAFLLAGFWFGWTWYVNDFSNEVKVADGTVITLDDVRDSLSSVEINLLKDLPSLGEVSLGVALPKTKGLYRSLGNMKVFQMVEDGILIVPTSRDHALSSKMLLLKGASGYVDDDRLRFGVWCYDGPCKLDMANGVQKTVHSFKEPNKEDAVRCYNDVVKAKQEIATKIKEAQKAKEAEVRAEKERQVKLEQIERERKEEEDRMRPIIQSERKKHLLSKLERLVNNPAVLVEVPAFLVAHIKYIKWASPVDELIAAKGEGDMVKAFNVIEEVLHGRAALVTELPEKDAIDSAWDEFISNGENLKYVIQFDKVDDIGMLYTPQCIVGDKRPAQRSAIYSGRRGRRGSGFDNSPHGGSRYIRFESAGVARKSAGDGYGGFICELTGLNLESKRWMLLEDDATALSKKAESLILKMKEKLDLDSISGEEYAQHVKAVVENVMAEASQVVAGYNGHETNGKVVDSLGTIIVDGRKYKTTPMTQEEIEATRKFADEEVAKLDFRLTNYLMIHRLINKAKRSIKVQEPEYAKLAKLKESGRGRELLKLIRGGQDVVTSNDVIRALAKLKETEFHFEINIGFENRNFGDPIIVKLNKDLGLTSDGFYGTVPFCVGGAKSYIIEAGALTYFQKGLLKLADEDAMRRVLEEKLSKEVTYDEDRINAQKERAAEAAAERRREAAERKREAAEREAERIEQRRQKWSLKGPGGRVM